MDKLIRIEVYRILRKLGAKREEITPETLLKKLIAFDEQEWTFFLFFLESRFNISINNEEEQKLVTIENTIDIVSRVCRDNS